MTGCAALYCQYEAWKYVVQIDEFGHFDHETPPDADLSKNAIAHYIAANESHNSILYKGATEKGVYNPKVAI